MTPTDRFVKAMRALWREHDEPTTAANYEIREAVEAFADVTYNRTLNPYCRPDCECCGRGRNPHRAALLKRVMGESARPVPKCTLCGSRPQVHDGLCLVCYGRMSDGPHEEWKDD